ncbi:hypothetical protein HK097_000502 [Rhizophlyctis rosea]|uniref:Uncharacterized protein n=1 Tax=Rhizophlyctis rosea TaxID=64517 RepID=A0AAD5X3N5_9FUNG|nr:hypothetical protein HK097_000502 [Rhizophlyctis rosea]
MEATTLSTLPTASPPKVTTAFGTKHFDPTSPWYVCASAPIWMTTLPQFPHNNITLPEAFHNASYLFRELLTNADSVFEVDLHNTPQRGGPPKVLESEDAPWQSVSVCAGGEEADLQKEKGPITSLVV